MTTYRSCHRGTLLSTIAVLLIFYAALASSWAQEPGEERSRLNEAMESAYHAREHVRGTALAEEALRVARSAFGDTDARTFTSLNGLAVLYSGQGRYGEAEPLHEQALERRRVILGPGHRDTLRSLSNLAALWRYPAAALRATQLAYIKARQPPDTWAPYVLIGGTP
jgi:Tetratricopeptide repeat